MEPRTCGSDSVRATSPDFLKRRVESALVFSFCGHCVFGCFADVLGFVLASGFVSVYVFGVVCAILCLCVFVPSRIGA